MKKLKNTKSGKKLASLIFGKDTRLKMWLFVSGCEKQKKKEKLFSVNDQN